MNKDRVIAIDGPSGGGKSSVTKYLAEQLGLVHIDTGALFRTLALLLSENFDFESLRAGQQVQAAEKFLHDQKLQYAPGGDCLIQVNGVDWSRRIREHHVSHLASQFSQLAFVREFCKNWQVRIVAESSRISILEGRDIGSVIFPNAMVKIFLTASDDSRAKRRWLQLKESGQLGSTSLEEIKADIMARDKADSERELSPLVVAKDAIEVDTSEMDFQQVCEKCLQLIKSEIKSC